MQEPISAVKSLSKFVQGNWTLRFNNCMSDWPEVDVADRRGGMGNCNGWKVNEIRRTIRENMNDYDENTEL